VVIVEILELVPAHIEYGVRRIVQDYELAVTTGYFQLADNERGGTGTISLHRDDSTDNQAAAHQNREGKGCYQSFIPPHGRHDCRSWPCRATKIDMEKIKNFNVYRVALYLELYLGYVATQHQPAEQIGP